MPKGVIRIRKSKKNRQQNGQKKNGQKKNGQKKNGQKKKQDLQNIHIKLKILLPSRKEYVIKHI